MPDYSFKTVILIGALLQATFSVAAPLNKSQLQLAMLEFSSTYIPPGPAVKSAPKKIAVSSYPSNCLLWNKRQILNKSKPFDSIINSASRQYRVDGNLIRSVITAESCFKSRALSSAGAQGLMQLIPATARRFGVKNSYKPKQNIKGGVKYLKFLLDRYKGNLNKTIAAYNAGEGKVDRHNGIPPYKETRQYVKNVLKIYAMLNPKISSKDKPKRVKAVYYPPMKGQKPGRHGWQYNRRLAPHLYKH